MAELIIPARYYHQWADPDVPCREANLTYGEQTLVIPADQAALVLVDVWDVHPMASHLERTNAITRERIVPVVWAARASGLTIIHAPSPAVARKYPQWTRYASDDDLWPSMSETDWPPTEFARREGRYAAYSRPKEWLRELWEGRIATRRILADIEPEPDDFVIATGSQLHRLLKDRGILHLFYAGFATNICVPFRDYGMRAFRKRGYNLILLRDCTTAIETHDTVDDLLITHLAIRDFEMMDIAWTTASEDFRKACES